MLFMPGSNTRALEKALSLACDGVIFDLEDAVAPEAKEAARKNIVDAVKAGGYQPREILVRVNSLDTPWCLEDIDAAASAGVDGIVLPKVSTPKQLETIADHLLDTRAAPHTRVWAMIETPQAVFNILSLAAQARDSEARLAGFIMGPNDLAKETRVRLVPGRAPMLAWFSSCIMAAHMYGLDILDGPYSDFADKDGFARECAQGRDFGFDGKSLIHPDQIGPANDTFSPSAAEVALAEKIIDAFEQPENADKGVVQIDGRMVERLHAEMARRTVAIAAAIAS
jgi:citrate lyase subunit beta/citryl-CoA lyase